MTSENSSPQRQLHLNAFLMSTGHHEASWRLPESDPHSSTNVEHYKQLAQTAERGRLDSIFFAASCSARWDAALPASSNPRCSSPPSPGPRSTSG